MAALLGFDGGPLRRRPRALAEQVAWRTRPSWHVLSTEDHTANPDLQRRVSKRMGANETEVARSHVSMPILAQSGGYISPRSCRHDRVERVLQERDSILLPDARLELLPFW